MEGRPGVAAGRRALTLTPPVPGCRMPECYCRLGGVTEVRGDDEGNVLGAWKMLHGLKSVLLLGRTEGARP